MRFAWLSMILLAVCLAGGCGPSSRVPEVKVAEPKADAPKVEDATVDEAKVDELGKESVRLATEQADLAEKMVAESDVNQRKHAAALQDVKLQLNEHNQKVAQLSAAEMAVFARFQPAIQQANDRYRIASGAMNEKAGGRK